MSQQTPAYHTIPLADFQQEFKDTSTEVSSLALGGRIVSFSDEFFAEASNLLKVEPSASLAGQFGPKGALYDGWETRRHNAPDHDWLRVRRTFFTEAAVWRLRVLLLASFEAAAVRPSSSRAKSSSKTRECGRRRVREDHFFERSEGLAPQAANLVIIALGPPSSRITGFDIDTAHFTGNYGPEASVWGMKLDTVDKKGLKREEGKLDGDDPRWELLLPVVPLGPDSRHLFKLERPTEKVYSHIKLCQIPDGGIGRFRVYGTPLPPLPTVPATRIDLAFAHNGGRVVAQSNQHYGVASNLLLPGRGVDMGDGWETKRSREEGHCEWAVIKLGDTGLIDHVEIDTAFHMGNFPMYAELHAIRSTENIPPLENEAWTSILPKKKMGPHRQHFFPAENCKGKPYTHVKLTIWPDGGLKRVRIMGYQASADESSALPASHQTRDILHVEALPLTYEAFLPYGRVIQAFSGPTAAPRGIAKTTANQGTACKYHKMVLMEDKFVDKKDKKTSIGVIRSQPRVSTGSEVDITVLERHPLTNQAFVPLGQSTGSGSSIGGAKMGKGSYVVMAALPDTTGQPDLSTLRVFTVPSSQGICFNAGIWHNPLMTADEQMDFACIESFDAKTDKVDTDFYRLQGNAPFAQFTLPKSEFSSSTSSATTAVQAGKESASTAFASLKSMLPTLSNPASSGSIACASLTTEGFAEFGHVVQGYDSAETAPAYARVAVSSEFKNVKCMDLAPVDETYPEEANATTGISVFRCTPKDGMQKGKPWSVKLMERHPFTDQTFLPMGLTTIKGKGEEPLPEGAAYIVIVAKTGKDDRPDPSTLKAFYCNANQGVHYARGIWHHPMLTVGGPIDFACVEAQIGHKGDPRDCELLEFEQGLGVVDIPAF
ncbi:hypothetical protein QFC22_006221 [Naganishia vaughanmartiniae]|uniref:Uncharacterized protein n=1 Tax=Naganishia vaughanmartiniae TaxID=1424756 RepID=A0ACC2WLU5_9TREE|nr:hypothetical protein QFC22_006221 [Naganishia vaughanmartiniae]